MAIILGNNFKSIIYFENKIDNNKEDYGKNYGRHY